MNFIKKASPEDNQLIFEIQQNIDNACLSDGGSTSPNVEKDVIAKAIIDTNLENILKKKLSKKGSFKLTKPKNKYKKKL